MSIATKRYPIMAGIKRRVDSVDDGERKRSKVKTQQKEKNGAGVSSKKPHTKQAPKPELKKPLKQKKIVVEEENDEDISEKEEEDEPSSGVEADEKPSNKSESTGKADSGNSESDRSLSYSKRFHFANCCLALDPDNSREAHAKQKQLALERRAAKPNADAVARTKKLWERLRRKSHVPVKERRELVVELQGIVNGRVKEFVFKHDSVRVIQTALKYATPDERKSMALELKGEYRSLAESKYAKFLLGKLLVHGDTETRDMVVPEFWLRPRNEQRYFASGMGASFRCFRIATTRVLKRLSWQRSLTSTPKRGLRLCSIFSSS
jgi:pumilio family protein 6